MIDDPLKNAEEFFALARERQNIYHKKESGSPPPWTDDPVMQSIYLCNVFREQDKTTKWFRENIREVYDQGDHVRSFASTVLFRWFNRIETGEYIFPERFEKWLALIEESLPYDAGEYLFNELEMMDPPHFTSAYMIKAENTVRKTLSVATAAAFVTQNYIQEVRENKNPVLFPTLQGWTEWLTGFQGLGGFMAYEIVTDLRHTHLARESTDIMTWANTGPGCARGLSRIYYGVPTHALDFARDKYRTNQVMRWLLELSRDEKYWPKHEPAWEMREVEHMLCEFDKVLRVRNKEGRSKRRYDKGRGIGWIPSIKTPETEVA